MKITYSEIALRLLIAMAVGLLMGGERKLRGKPVGARTYVILSVSATSIAMVSAFGFNNNITGYDSPARLMVGILTGVGFLCAGVIWRSPEGDVQGLTTAADLYSIVCIAIAIGLGYYFLAGMAIAIIFITLISSYIYANLNARKKHDETNLSVKQTEAGTTTVKDNIENAKEPPIILK